MTGGQDVVVTPELDRARIALFVFRERVGRVTREELDRVRGKRKEDRIRILAFFPKQPFEPEKLADDVYAEDWAKLMKYKKELTSDWNEPDSYSVTPCCAYTNKEDLLGMVRDKIEQVHYLRYLRQQNQQGDTQGN